MLTFDLARIEFHGNEVKPRYVSRKEAELYLPLCEEILSLFHSGIGKQRSELSHAVASLEQRGDFKIVRGLTKLVEDECVFAPAEELDYAALRAAVFRAAQRRYPLVTRTDLLHPTHRDEAVAALAAECGISREHLESRLFADLPQYHVLRAVKASFTPERLLQRYNLALAQALLYRASEMTVTLHSDFKIVWKYLKLARLIHEITQSADGYTIRLTGPASVFRYTQRYGIRMALFLPGLLLAQRFTMEALVNVNDKLRIFRLDERCGLHSHYRETPGAFDSSLEEHFYQSFLAHNDTQWTIHRESDLIDLGDTVVVPDFTFTHPDGRKAYLEIVGFWTPEYIQKKLSKLARVQETNFIVAISRTLNCSRSDLEQLRDKKAIMFKTVLKPKDVVERLETLP
jgi:predicted nuclease of restriction endonuclease-like RecB superfamily